MAEIWKSGIERKANGYARLAASMNVSHVHRFRRPSRADTSAWRIMGGHESGFSRLRAPVVFMRAVSEDSSLFNFSFDDEYDGASYGACIRRKVASCVA